MVEVKDWRWYGKAGHFIGGFWCRFHLCTEVGNYLVSTVGELLWDETTREIDAASRGIELVGRGDARLANFMSRIGYSDVGFNRKFETMVFRTTGERCEVAGCDCGMPTVDASELDFAAANINAEATANHMRLCAVWADRGEASERHRVMLGDEQ